MDPQRLQQAIEKRAKADLTSDMRPGDRALVQKHLRESSYKDSSPLMRGASMGALGGLGGAAIGGPIGAAIGMPLGAMAGMASDSGLRGISPKNKRLMQQRLLEQAQKKEEQSKNPGWLERKFGGREYGKMKESAGCKKASVDLSAQRGAALAKAAMADPDFREAAEMMVKEGSFWKNVAVGTAGLALAPVAYGVGQMGMNAVQKAYQSLTEGKNKAKAYSEMMKVHKKQLGSEDKSKIQTAFNSLWGLNPDMAKDPLVSGTYVTKAIDYGGVTTQEAGQLVSARKTRSDARAAESWMPDPRAMGTATKAFADAPKMMAD